MHRNGIPVESPQFDADDLAAIWAHFDFLYCTPKNMSPEQQALFDQWRRTREEKLSERQKALLGQYIDRWRELHRMYSNARSALSLIESRHAKYIKLSVDLAIGDEWTEYAKYCASLDPALQKQLGYEVAKRGYSHGRSSFHGFSSSQWHAPFSFCGWSGNHSEYAAFRIDRECFPDGPVHLYYSDDDGWSYDESQLSLICHLSSGISNLHIKSKIDNPLIAKYIKRCIFMFDLDASAIKPSIHLNGQTVSANELGGYILVLPRCGEFYCELGELRNGEMIPLHRDDFCMKKDRFQAVSACQRSPIAAR